MAPAPPPRSPAFEAFVAPARARPQVWRTAAGLLLAAVVWLAAVSALPALLAGGGGIDPGRLLTVGYLASFAALLAGLALALRVLHRRGLATLLGPAGLQPRAYAAGAAVVLAMAAAAALPMALGAVPVQQLPLAVWAAWLPAALVAVAVQTAAEEMAFRGYFMQQLAARFEARAIWLGVPALVFGGLHWNPALFGANAWLVVANTAVVGLVLGDVTARLGNLSAAMGLHFANNAVAILVMAMPSPLAGLGLWLAPVGPQDVAVLRAMLLADTAATLAVWGVWLLWRRRRAQLQMRGPDSI